MFRLRVTRSHRWGFPCCVQFPVLTCCHQIPRQVHPGGIVLAAWQLARMTAAFPEQRAGRLLHYHFRGLLGVHITLRPVSSPIALRDLSIESFSPDHHRDYLRYRPDCYRLERLPCRAGISPLKTNALSRRTVDRCHPYPRDPRFSPHSSVNKEFSF